LIAPPDGEASERLIDVALRALQFARTVDLSWIVDRGGDKYPNIWPGEHYKLLTALVAALAPKTVVEIGTATGLSTLAIMDTLAADGKLVTYDIVSWREFPRPAGHSGVVLRDEDFADGRLEQRVEDLTTSEGWNRNADTVRQADFVFVDVKHDGIQERRLLRFFEETGFTNGPIVMFDDIRLWKLLSFWREIDRPKLDLTSFGHWSGTGLVDFA